MKFDLLLKNGLIVTESDVYVGGSVAVLGGKIVMLAKSDLELDATTVVDLDGKVLLPGLVDGHVHFNEPGRTEWEGYHTGTMAAAAGGITTIVDMPLNATPPTINVAELARKRAVVANQAVVDYAHWGGLVDNNVDELATMLAEGVVGFKGFMSESGVDFARVNDDILYAAFRELPSDAVVALHAENDTVTRYLAAQLQAQGRIDRSAWHESRPPIVEVEAIQRAALWAQETEGRVHIVHASTAEAVRAVNDARARGVNITVETCPHYLFFDMGTLVTKGPVAKCAPPLRCREQVEGLWHSLLDGQVDVIGSDHSPCTWPLKKKGHDNIWEAWGGISGIQSMLPVMLSEGINHRQWALTRLVKTMCANPARLYGLYPQKGALALGADADFVVVDLTKEWTLSADELFYKNKHSPYVEHSFRGQVHSTYVRGTKVYQQHAILVQPGYGQLLKRRPSASLLN